MSPESDSLARPQDDVRTRRERLFRETPGETLRRHLLGAAWALRPHRIGGLPALWAMHARALVAPRQELPHADAALPRPAGLCGIAHDLSVPTLVEAYRRGLYPFAHIGPMKWWAPPERCILAFDDVHLSKRLRSRLRQNRYRVTFDRAFDDVIKACAAPRENKWSLTWITPEIMHAFAALHDAGHAHSFEVWNGDDVLVAGGYGVAAGGCFTIESQFTRESHCSKIGFAMLTWHLARWGFVLADNKGPTRNTLEMGFRVVPRASFQAQLTQALFAPGRPGPWQVEADLPTVAAWEPAAAAPRTAAASSRRLRYGAALIPVLDLLDGSLALADAAGSLL